jgi:hypothetical protein
MTVNSEQGKVVEENNRSFIQDIIPAVVWRDLRKWRSQDSRGLGQHSYRAHPANMFQPTY